MALKEYANEHPKYKKKKDNNLEVASASWRKKNEKLSNKILNELMSDYVLEDLEKSIKKKKK